MIISADTCTYSCPVCGYIYFVSCVMSHLLLYHAVYINNFNIYISKKYILTPYPVVCVYFCVYSN